MRLPLIALIAALALTACPRSQPKAIDPKAEADGLYIKATSEYLQGDFVQALKDFEEVRKKNPSDVRLPAAIGEVQLSSGKLKEALAEFQTAAKRDPKRGTTWSRIGFIQLQFGKLAEARSALQKAIGLNPRDYNALEGLGDLEQKQGNVDQAVDDWMHAAEAGPPAGAPALWMKAAHALREKDRAKEAIALLQKAKGAHVAAPELSTLLGDLLVHQGNLVDAATAYEDAAKQSNKDPSLWELVGEIETRLDRPANAEAAFHESLQLKDRAVVHVALGRLYLKQKDEARARQELELALRAATGEERREGPELADLLYSLGRHKDAYLLLKVAAAEPDAAKDVALQRRTASLAKEEKDFAVVEATCKRVKAAGDAARCP